MKYVKRLIITHERWDYVINLNVGLILLPHVILDS